MKKLTGEEIRRLWIKFFENRGHKYLSGVSLIPDGDKSLLWVNAGVTGLKKYFDGSEIPPSRRIVNVQKSIRTNDIENVGHTARHHTFFEMLGNFSIGDYFRKEVIPWAYQILTSTEEGFGLDKDKLYVTYNPDDQESFLLWQKAGITKDHLIPLESNFWQIGEGPCGPNTEVFYDRGEKWDPKHLGKKLLEDDIENDRYIELWGIVFSQYNAENGVDRKNYKELPSKNIDTGAGLERIACILQETPTNFETDLFMPIIKATEALSKKKYEGDNLMAFRVIADHIRCLTFALSDGASFSNEGRGYVLRRIIRRAMRYGQKLSLNEPFMYKLVQVVIDKYSSFYPELKAKQELIENQIKNEEEKFIKTLSSGEALLMSYLNGQKTLSGDIAFKLYDTYGFPFDLTKEIASEKGVKVDEDTFLKLMEEQRERARSARGEIESFKKQSKDLLSFKDKSEFTYDKDTLTSKVIGLFVDGVKVKEITSKGEAIFLETPFYAEMGGQVSDTGSFYTKEGKGKIVYVGEAPNKQHLHQIVIEKGKIQEGEEITLKIDVSKRRNIEKNHSATHLLHSALKEVLNRQVDQKGSYVDENYLRFDYDAIKPLSKEEKEKVEYIVNQKINDMIEEKTLVLPIDEAKKLGAEMEFSSKYQDLVRVVTFGDFSKEFCGGTHVKNTSEISLFVIVSDEAISSGVRRISAKTGLAAYTYCKDKVELLKNIEDETSSNDKDIKTKIDLLINNEKEDKKTILLLRDQIASLEAKTINSEIQNINGISFLFYLKEGASRNDLLALGDRLKSNNNDYIFVLLGGKEGARPIVALAKGKGKESYSANTLLKDLSKVLLGGGGGKEESASGQVKTAEGFFAFKEKVKGKLSDAK